MGIALYWPEGTSETVRLTEDLLQFANEGWAVILIRESSRRNKAEGRLDKVGAWVLEMVGWITGRTSHKVKGKAARTRGSVRMTTGGAKGRAGR